MRPAPRWPQAPARSPSTWSGHPDSATPSAPTSCRCSAAMPASSSSTRRPLGDFAPLQDAIGDVQWVFHAASQDLPSLRELDLVPPSIFDTELASRLLGHERVGLAAVVENTLGITLKKEHSAADWSTRPLPASLARVRGTRRAAPDRRATRPWRRSSRNRARPSSPPRSSRRRSPACPEAAPRRSVATAERTAPGARSPQPRGRPLPLAGARVLRPGPGRLPRAPGSRPLADRGRPRATRRASRRSPASRSSRGAPAARSSTAGGRPSSTAARPRSFRASACRATRCHLPAHGRTATPRPTRDSRPRVPWSRRSPKSWRCRPRTC